MLKGKQTKLDLNKNGKLDAEDFKMIRSGKKATGGGVEMKTGGKAKGPKRTKYAIGLDSEIKAKKPGRRVSESGNVYYESRPNHSDENRKKKPYLEMGGYTEESNKVVETKWNYSIGGI